MIGWLIRRMQHLGTRLGFQAKAPTEAATKFAIESQCKNVSPDDITTVAVSKFFDANWYLAQYQDVRALGIDPAWHYIAYGAREGRDPGPQFSTLWYFARNPDVQRLGLNPLLHYHRHGAAEGRRWDGPAPETVSDSLAPSAGRSQYKQVWNLVSRTEDDAKISVSGYTSEERYRLTGEATRSMLQRYVGVKKDDVILEIGAGVGRVGAVLAPLCREWIGADVSENMVAHMQQRLRAFTNVRTAVLNGFDLQNIPSESIDLIYCTVVFMHLEEWERYAYVREGLRVLRPGGRMLVDNANLLSDEGWEMFQELAKLQPSERPPNISKLSTPDELATYFRRAGFDKIGQDTSGIWVITYGEKPAPSGDKQGASFKPVPN